MENKEVIDKNAKDLDETPTAETKKPKKKQKQDNERIENLEKELLEVKDSWMRTLAEYDNFRKRSQKEKESVCSDTRADVLEKLLPVLDNFERAAENTNASLEDYQKGINMIINQLIEATKAMNLEAFGSVGDKFDPNMHSAVMHIEDEKYGENEIVDVFQKGYKIKERILRPASVRVAN